MNEKFNFFKSQYELTLVDAEKIRNDFLNFAKFSPLLLGLSYFFYDNKEHPISFCGNQIDFYNVFLVVNIISFFIFILLTFKGFIFYPKASLISSPGALSKHWDELKDFDNGKDEAESFQHSMLPKYIEAA